MISKGRISRHWKSLKKNGNGCLVRYDLGLRKVLGKGWVYNACSYQLCVTRGQHELLPFRGEDFRAGGNKAGERIEEFGVLGMS